MPNIFADYFINDFLNFLFKDWTWKTKFWFFVPLFLVYLALFPPKLLKTAWVKFKKIIKFLLLTIFATLWFMVIKTGNEYTNQTQIKQVVTEPEKADDAFQANPTPQQQQNYICNEPNQKFCSTFDDLTQFEGFMSFTSDPGNSRLLKTNISINNSKNNPNLFIKDKLFDPNINFKWKLKPNNDSVINGTIDYGEIWRCIVGENGYDRITCERYPNINTQKKRYQTYFSEVGKKPILPKTEITINGNVHLNNDNTLAITLTVNYTTDEQKSDSAVFNYILPILETEPEKMVNKFGVGIIDKEGNIRIEFLELSLF